MSFKDLGSKGAGTSMIPLDNRNICRKPGKIFDGKNHG
jgi:hypothetical protein